MSGKIYSRAIPNLSDAESMAARVLFYLEKYVFDVALSKKGLYVVGNIIYTDVFGISQRLSGFGYMVAPATENYGNKFTLKKLSDPGFWFSN